MTIWLAPLNLKVPPLYGSESTVVSTTNQCGDRVFFASPEVNSAQFCCTPAAFTTGAQTRAKSATTAWNSAAVRARAGG